MSFISSFKYVSDKFKSNKYGKYTPINEQVNITASSSNSGSGNIEVENIREPVVVEEVSITPPKDDYNIIYYIFFLQGISMLLPWNVFITASVYFHTRFVGSPYVNNFQNYFSFVFMIISFIFLGLALYTHGKDLVSPTAYFYFVIFLVGISGVTTGYLQNDTFGTAAQISPKYTQAVMSGQGLAGLGASISQIFSILNSRQLTNYGDDDVELSNSAFIYFLSAFIILVISLISYVILTKLPLFLYHHQNKNINVIIEEEESEEQSLLNKNLFNITFTKIIRLVYSIIFVFMITLSLYPSITTSVKSTVKDDERSGYQKDYLFIPIHFLMFNFGDLLGKSLPIIKFFAIKNIDLLMLMSTSRPQIQNVNKGLAGTLLTFCMVLGLTIGSLLSFPMRSLSCGGCNPFIN
nr:8528_t:CDS:2 [Entrophospora candida]